MYRLPLAGEQITITVSCLCGCRHGRLQRVVLHNPHVKLAASAVYACTNSGHPFVWMASKSLL